MYPILWTNDDLRDRIGVALPQHNPIKESDINLYKQNFIATKVYSDQISYLSCKRKPVLHCPPPVGTVFLCSFNRFAQLESVPFAFILRDRFSVEIAHRDIFENLLKLLNRFRFVVTDLRNRLCDSDCLLIKTFGLLLNQRHIVA